MSKFTIHAFNPIHAKSLIANNSQYIDKIIVGSNRFGLRQVSEFSLDEIEVVANFAHKFDVKCFVAVNKIMHNSELDELARYLESIAEISVDGVMFSDLAVKYIIAENNLKLKAMYSTETTITNTSFTRFAKQGSINAIEVAKEITLDEVNQIAENKECCVSVQVHGHMYMYQSIRNIVDNFSEYQGKEMKRESMQLYDPERKKSYPLIQNDQGTHMLASHNIAMIHKLNDFNLDAIDSLRIDPLLYTPSEYSQIVSLYIEAYIQLTEDAEKYIATSRDYLKRLKMIKEGQKYSTGFFYKKTMF